VISITTALGFLESADGQHEIRALLAEPCVGAGWGWPPSEVHLRRWPGSKACSRPARREARPGARSDGDDKVRINSTSLDNPLVVLKD